MFLHQYHIVLMDIIDEQPQESKKTFSKDDEKSSPIIDIDNLLMKHAGATKKSS